MIQKLAPKAASFFRMRFNGAVKQFASQGYPASGEDTKFLNYKNAIVEYPAEAFDM